MDRRRGRAGRAHRRAHVGRGRARDGRSGGAAPRGTCSSSESPNARRARPHERRVARRDGRAPEAAAPARERAGSRAAARLTRPSRSDRPAPCRARDRGARDRERTRREAVGSAQHRRRARRAGSRARGAARPTVLDDLGLVPAFAPVDREGGRSASACRSTSRPRRSRSDCRPRSRPCCTASCRKR